MKSFIESLKNRVLAGEDITFEEAKRLIELDIDTQKEEINYLIKSANEIRKHFCGDKFNLCTIMNAKSGRCPENCTYCAQSAHYKTNAPVYDLKSKEEALELAKVVEKEGANRFSLVTSGKGVYSERECSELAVIYRYLSENTDIHLCASHGILTKESAEALKKSGVKTYHHNLETSREFYPNICTTHTYQDRINTILYCKEIGLDVCSGGIFGLGESQIDRVKMAFELKNLEITSIPLNFLVAIEGTPLENMEPLPPLEIVKTIAVYRFINTKAYLRYAGGRIQLGDFERVGLRAGINSALTGNFLTTTGSTIESDKNLLKEEGFSLEK